MTKFRKTGHDLMPPKSKKPEEKPGTLNEHHIPIYDHKDRMRGHVGPKATEVTVARFTGQHGSKLGKRDGKPAWISPPPPPPKPPQVDPTALAVAETQAKAGPQEHKLSIELNQAKGSVTKTPTKPETRARPKRG
jgi:hypothetical protein